MANELSFNRIIKGQQLKIFFDDNKTIVFKTENSSQGTRFVVFGDTVEGEKVLIPAFTTEELDTKYSNDKSQRTNNCIDWKSETRFHKITSRSLDIEEIYLLNAEGNLRKYDGAFTGNVSFDKSGFYLSAEPTYDFNDVKLLYFKTVVRQILLDSKKGSLLIDEKVSLLQQALVGNGEKLPLKSIKPLTMKERVMFFVEAISQLPDIIDLFVYYQELENDKNLEINDVISQSELLQKLNIKTGFNFTKEELTKFKIKLEVIENNEETNILQVNLNLAYKIDDNKWNQDLIATEVKIKPKLKNKLSLLSNLFFGNDSMVFMNKFGVLMSTEDKENTNIFFPKLYSKIEEIDIIIKKFISLSDEDKNTVHALIKTQQQWKENIKSWENKPWLSDAERLAGVKKDTENLNNTTEKIEELLVLNDKNKQKILNDLIIKMKLVNNLQMLSYLQKTLFVKSKEYLIASNVFYQVHNLSPKMIEEYANYYVKSKNQNNNLHPTDSFTEIDNLLNNNFSEFVGICKLLPIELHNKPIYIIFKLINFLDEFKNIEFNKLLGRLSKIRNKLIHIVLLYFRQEIIWIFMKLYLNNIIFLN